MNKRPVGVTIIGVLQELVGITLFLLGLAVLFLSATASSVIGELGGVLGLAALLVGPFDMVVGWGFLNAQGWAWAVGILFNIIGIILAIAGLASRSTIVGAGGLAISLVIVLYLAKRSVRVYFGQALPLREPTITVPPQSNTQGVSYSRVVCKHCGSQLLQGANKCGVCGGTL